MPTLLPEILILALKIVGGIAALIGFLCLLAASYLIIVFKKNPPEDWNK